MILIICTNCLKDLKLHFCHLHRDVITKEIETVSGLWEIIFYFHVLHMLYSKNIRVQIGFYERKF